VIFTVAGGGPDNLPAPAANLSSPNSVAVDGRGNAFIVATGQNQIFRVDGSGQLTRVAGDGTAGFSGDGGLATDASFDRPTAIALDTAGNFFVADNGNLRIRRVDAATGVITTVAGNGTNGFSGDGGDATSAGLANVYGVALDADGSLYIADSGNSRIRRVDAATGIITTVAGNGTYGFSGDGDAATSAALRVAGVTLDAAGNFFIADSGNSRIRRVDAATGIITTVAGNGTSGFSGDGGAATSARLSNPFAVALDAAGNLFIADNGNSRVRRVDAVTGVITTVAGNGDHRFSGDGGLATSAGLIPSAVALDSSGNLLIADYLNHRIRRVDAGTGIITTFAGSGSETFGGDGAAATSASLANPKGVAVDPAGSVFIADTENQRIRRIDSATGIITTVAGNGAFGFSVDGGLAMNVSLADPSGVALDAANNLFIADYFSSRIRRVDAATGIITTVAGNGIAGFGGDGGAATSARLWNPNGVALDASGNLFIVDSSNNRIRRVDAASGIITTVAGTGARGFGGDGGPATNARLNGPLGIAVDAAGSSLIADYLNNRIRRVDAATGLITSVVGNGFPGFSGDGGSATRASIRFPSGVALDAAQNLLIADTFNTRIRRVDAATGIITTAAGNGTYGFSGDGGAATSASLNIPSGVASDAVGNIFVADSGNDRIRQVGDAVITITIDLDIKPDGTPNSINPTDEGVIPVAILGSETFDVSEVDGTTLIFANGEAPPAHDLADPSIFADHLEDVNGDGFADLVSHYHTEDTGIGFGEMMACLRGETLDDVPFNGCDAVRTVPDMDGDQILDPDEEGMGTNAFFRDSDGDGYDDGLEVLTMGTDPLDALDPAPAEVDQQKPSRLRNRRH
jgi:sugar lactone lactonase YvrE